MPSLRDTLKMLNKNLQEADKFRIASDYPREFFETEFITTGSPRLDYLIKGIGLGRLNLITGWEGAGKSTLALIIAREYLKNYPDKYVYYNDSEKTVDNSYLDRMEIDRSRFIIQKESNLENSLDACTEFSKTDDIGMIIYDSVKSSYSSIVEKKTASEMTIGVEARIFNARMPIIASNCERRKIALIVLNQWRSNPAITHGSSDVLPGGNWQKFLPSLHLDMGTKSVAKKNFVINTDTGEVLGHKVKLRVKKSKFGAFSPTKAYELKLLYGEGFDRYSEFAELFVELGIIDKKTGWYKLPNVPKRLQGIESVSTFLKENEDYLTNLIKISDEQIEKEGTIYRINLDDEEE